MAIDFKLLDSMDLYGNEKDIWQNWWENLSEQEKMDAIAEL
jgi:hypothetical protein